MGSKRLELQKKGNILYLELTAPPANQTDHLFFQELSDIMPKLSEYDDVRGLIIYGSGRHFSSGANIVELKDRVQKKDACATRELMKQSVDLFYTIYKSPYPVVAAIQGCCMGSGLELALSCHYRVATKNGLFSLPETTFGLMPGCGGTIHLPPLLGLSKSIQLILSGDSLLAEDAKAIGLIDLIVDKKDLIGSCEKMIHTFQPSLEGSAA